MISPLINRLINEALCIGIHVSINTASARRRPSFVSDKLVPALWFQSVSPGCSGVLGFPAAWSQERKRVVRIFEMSCCPNSCCQRSIASDFYCPFQQDRALVCAWDVEQLWHKTPDFITPVLWPSNMPTASL